MNKFPFILFLFIFQITFGQSNLDDLKKYMEHIENVSELSNIKNKKFEVLSVFLIQNEIERSIDFGFKHHRILVEPDQGYDIKLNLISRNGKIQIAWISEYDSYKEGNLNTMTLIKNPDFLIQYVQNHNKLYQTKLTEQDFINQTLKEYVVGFGCGITASNIPKQAKKMLKFVKHKNRKMLQEYLTSFSPELQTLGAIGLIRLGNLSPLQKNIIEHFKKRNSVISTCAGCLYGLNEKFTKVIKQNIN